MFSFNCKSYTKRCTSFYNILFITEVENPLLVSPFWGIQDHKDLGNDYHYLIEDHLR